MSRRIVLLLGALAALLALPAMAGASVAFTRLTAPYTFSKQPLNPAIWVANNDGSAARKLPVTGTDPQISPDGTMVAYLVMATPSYSSTLHIVTIATGVDVNTKTQCENPAWAPNSSAVSCDTTSKSLSGLVAVTPAGKVTVVAESSSSSVRISWNSAAWSPDSTMLAWSYDVYKSKNAQANPVLRAKRVDGTGSLLKLGNGSGPVWGPTRIAFYRFTGSNDNVLRSTSNCVRCEHNSLERRAASPINRYARDRLREDLAAEDHAAPNVSCLRTVLADAANDHVVDSFRGHLGPLHCLVDCNGTKISGMPFAEKPFVAADGCPSHCNDKNIKHASQWFCFFLSFFSFFFFCTSLSEVSDELDPRGQLTLFQSYSFFLVLF